MDILIRQSGLKRVLCFVMCLLVTVLTFYVQYQEAYAVIPIVLGGAALVGAVTLLIAAGLSFNSTTAATNSASNWFSGLTSTQNESVLQKFTEFYEKTSSIKVIDDLLWQNVRDWVNSYYDAGENVKSSVNYPLTGETVPYFYTFDTSDIQAKYEIITLPGVSCEWVFRERLANCDYWDLYKDGDWYNSYQCKIGIEPYLYLYAEDGNSLRVMANYVYTNGADMPIPMYRTWDYSEAISDARIRLGTSEADMSATGATDVVDNPAWDIPRTVEGDRAVVVPNTIADAVGKTYEDVAAESSTDTPAEPEEPTQEWDKTKWVVPADVIKNKFPFSIPWDLKNAVTSLTATPEAPHWTINFPSNIFVGGGRIDINFQQFESWAKIIRWGVLIFFNIFLILSTRKIIGAGG